MEGTATLVNEKREAPRHPVEIEIVCCPYSSSRSIRHCTGLLRNYSSGGLYFEAPHEYKPGTILVIRTTRGRSTSVVVCGEGWRSISLAEVKWQMELSASDFPCYGIGLRYLD